jgi:hypothetical protein
VLSDHGEVVGIVSGKVNAATAFLKEGELPEPTNFAFPIDEGKVVLSAAFPFGYAVPQATQKLAPSEIFSGAKPAVVFVVGSISPRNSTHLLQNGSREKGVDLRRFVQAFIDDGGSHAELLAELLFHHRIVGMELTRTEQDRFRFLDALARQSNPPNTKNTLRRHPCSSALF